MKAKASEERVPPIEDILKAVKITLARQVCSADNKTCTCLHQLVAINAKGVDVKKAVMEQALHFWGYNSTTTTTTTCATTEQWQRKQKSFLLTASSIKKGQVTYTLAADFNVCAEAIRALLCIHSGRRGKEILPSTPQDVRRERFRFLFSELTRYREHCGQLNLDKAREMSDYLRAISLPKLEKVYENHFKSIVTLFPNQTDSVSFIERIGGRLISLDDSQRQFFDFLNKHPPSIPSFYGVSNNCNNVRFSFVDGDGFSGVLTTRGLLNKCTEHHMDAMLRLDANLRKEVVQLSPEKITTSNVQCRASYLRSSYTEPQKPHIDFHWDVFDKANQPFVAFSPLSHDGCFLQLWDKNAPGPGNVCHIPFGVLLVVPGDTVHGGGFCSTLKGDLRLHFYIFINQVNEVAYSNTYVDRQGQALGVDFPQCESMHEIQKIMVGIK
jgi:hypothetical protein